MQVFFRLAVCRLLRKLGQIPLAGHPMRKECLEQVARYRQALETRAHFYPLTDTGPISKFGLVKLPAATGATV